MADQKISQLNEVTSPNSTDVLPIVNGGETKKITVANLAVAGSSGTSGTSGSSGSNGTNGSSGTSGSNGSSGSNGTDGSSGTSGYVDNDWLYFTPSTATIPSTGNNFILSGTTTSNGSVSYNQSTGIITLAANKTYKLNASFALANNINNAETQYQWINVTTSNTLIGNLAGVIVVNSDATAAWQPLAEAIIVTTGTTQVALRSTFSNSTGGFSTSQCFMMVTQINGWSGTSGTSGSNGSSGTSGSNGSSGSDGSSGTSGSSGSDGTSGTSGSDGSSGTSGSSGSSGTAGSSGSSGSSGTSPVDVLLKTTGTWTVPTGASTQSFTLDTNSSYSMWVNGNIPFGIIIWNATATLSNTNVPVVGAQYGWYYSTGNALVLTSMPNQFVGTNGIILNTPGDYASNTSNVFSFGITNNSGTSQTINYGYIKLS
jgi:hypothetical protein